MARQTERRALTGIEVRQDGDGPATIVGYASVFNKPSEDLGGFTEIIKPGAFDATLAAKADVRALVDHDPSKILGRTKSGSLKLTTDSIGLRAEITPPDTTAGRDVLESLRRGDLDGMSFGFVTVADEWRNEGGKAVRDVEAVDLFDVSVVTYPAYPDTTVALRSLNEWRGEQDTPDEPNQADQDQSIARLRRVRVDVELARG